jgi:hypothetical protein
MAVVGNRGTGPEPTDRQGSHGLVAYRLPDAPEMPIVAAPLGRAWMAETHENLATRCLPLVVANQSGWLLLNPEPFRVRWSGRTEQSSLEIERTDEAARPLRFVDSLFGHGVLTFTVPYLFRTPTGWNLEVRGPTNLPKDGIAALDAIVETDWAVATFTMNWKMTRVDRWVEFAGLEPIALVRPVPRGTLARFEPSVRDLREEPELLRQHTAWRDARRLHNGQRMVARRMFGERGSAAVGYQRHYWLGTSPGGAGAPDGEHDQRLNVRQFTGLTTVWPPTAIPGIRTRAAAGNLTDPPTASRVSGFSDG